MVQNLTGTEIVLQYDEIEVEKETDETVSGNADGNFQHPRFAPPWDIFQRLVMSLDVKKRCESGSYEDWARVGWAIAGVARAYKIKKRFEDGLELWLKFCKQCMDVYLEDPLKARVIYLGAKNRDQQLGWTSLMQSLKEDNNDVFCEISNCLTTIDGTEITDENDLKTIKKFVYASFRYKPNDIGQIVVKAYDDGSYIIANTKEERPYCSIFEGEHDPVMHPYVVIGLKTARNKCRHPNCKDRNDVVVDFTTFPPDLKTIVGKLLNKVETPEEAVRKFVMQRKEGDFPQMTDSDFELDVPKSTLFGQKYALTNNIYCPICKCRHDKPENCIFVNRAANLLAMECRLNRDNFHPPDGIVVPQNITNIIIQNANFNGSGRSEEPLEEDLFDDILPIFQDETLNRLVNASLKGYATDIARVFVHLGKHKFGVQSGDKDTWWAWDDLEKRWMRSNHKANLFCDEVVAQKYTDVMRWLRQNTPDSEKRTKRLQRIEQLLKRLKDRDQYSILSQVAILLKEEKRQFENLLDANKNIINFRGQVYDFEALSIRPIKVTDYVSKSTGYELPQVDVEQQKSIMVFIRSIMPDEAHVEYLLTWLASCLDGWNREETFHILKWSGRNGKSLLRDLLAPALGSTPETGYFGVVAASLLTKERPSSDRPVADLLHLKGKRLLIASEPEKGQRVNCGFLKFLTGNDPINGRWLNSNAEVSFQPQHSLVLLCNSIPNLDANDEAVWDRSRVLTFPYKFVTRPTLAHHRKSDTFLKSRLPGMGPQLMLILLQYYEKYKRYGLEPTPEMLHDTQDVRAENDLYGEFINGHCEMSNSKDAQIIYSDLVLRCQAWMKAHPIYRDGKTEFKATTLRDTMATFVGRKYSTQRPSDKDKGPQTGWSGVRFLPQTTTSFLPEDD